MSKPPSSVLSVVLTGLLCASGCALAVAPKNDGNNLGGSTSGGTGTTTGAGGDTAGGATSAGTGTGGTTGGASTLDPNAPTVTTALVGRFTDGAPGSQQFSWSASSMTAHFTGTGVGLALEELESAANPNGNYYDVITDGGAPATLAANAGASHYSLASNLPAGAHTVTVRRRTEGHLGTTRFGGFDVTGGQLTPFRAAAARRMLIIGDSISCGYGLEGTSATCKFSPATENASKTYGVRAAAALNADVQVIAWSGKGVYRNNDNTTTGTLPDVFDQTLTNESTPTWDPSSFVPQVIVINLHTNDFYQGVPSQSAFVSAYTSFLKTLRGYYPDAQIFCAVGPMLSDSYPAGQNALSNARAYITKVISTFGDSHVALIEFPALQTGQMGCDSHPNDAAHASMATQLTAAITQAAPW